MEQYENSIQHVCSMKESVQCRQLVTSQRAMREIIGVLSLFLIEFVRSAEVFYDGGDEEACHDSYYHTPSGSLDVLFNLDWHWLLKLNE